MCTCMSVWDRERDVKREKKNHTCNGALIRSNHLSFKCIMNSFMENKLNIQIIIIYDQFIIGKKLHLSIKSSLSA